jgi:hypothetical protein
MRTLSRPLATSGKILIIACWAILLGLLLYRDYFIEPLDFRESNILQIAQSEEYFSIFFRNQKIGHAVYRFAPLENNRWQLQQTAKMNLSVGGSLQKIDMDLDATLTKNQLLDSFIFTFRSPFYQMKAEGTVKDNNVQYQIDTGTNIIYDTLRLANAPMLASPRRSYLLTDNLEPGDKRKIPWFDPFSMTGKDSVLEYRGLESVLINGRVNKLHHFVEQFTGTRVNSWLDDKGLVIKEESPAGFVFLKEPKFKALAEPASGNDEILSAIAVQLRGAPPDLAVNEQSYRLSLQNPKDFDLHGGRQTYQNGILTIRKEMPISAPAGPGCAPKAADLQASPYIQADNEQVKDLARELTANRKEPLAQVQSISRWIFTNLEKRPVLGLPDAVTTLHTKKGDCNEHAALFAALARAAGIPTRIASGVTYYRNSFYYHAWNEVCIGGQWLSVDATTNQLPADISHIRFVYGELQDQVRIAGLLGNLAIEVMPNTDQ